MGGWVEMGLGYVRRGKVVERREACKEGKGV